jgi:hypothetical protein
MFDGEAPLDDGYTSFESRHASASFGLLRFAQHRRKILDAIEVKLDFVGFLIVMTAFAGTGSTPHDHKARVVVHAG